MHHQQIAIENAGILHAGALDAQQVVGVRREQRGIDPVLRLDVLGGEDGIARCHAAHQWQEALHRHAGHLAQTQSPRGAGRQFERALFGQRLQVIFGRAGGGKTEPCGDLGARGRHARGVDVAANPVEDLLLPRGEPRQRRLGGAGEVGERAAGARWHGMDPFGNKPYGYAVP